MTAISASTSDHTSWGIAGHNPNEVDVEDSQPNCMNKIVQWLRSDENSLVLKIAAVFVVSLGVIGTGFLTGHVILVSSLIAIPVLIWAAFEWYNLTNRENAAIERAELAARQRALALSQANAFQLMQNAVGGEAAFNQYPILDIGNRRGATGYLDFLTTQDLTHPIMRGVDSAGRPFISLKLRSSRPDDLGEEFVVTLFQRYIDEDRWTYGTTHLRSVFEDVIGDASRATIRQIVVTRDHPHFTLI